MKKANRDELIEQLSHKGVFLGYFQDKQQRIVQMYSGAPLIMDGDYLQYDFVRYKARVQNSQMEQEQSLQSTMRMDISRQRLRSDSLCIGDPQISQTPRRY